LFIRIDTLLLKLKSSKQENFTDMPRKEKQVRLQPSPNYGSAVKGVPMLRISGKWLQEFGFKAGEVVNITVREELLIIQPAKH